MTSAELSTLADINGETVHFQNLYSSLLHEQDVYHSVHWLSGDPLLLLVAILSDAICIQRSLLPYSTKIPRVPSIAVPSYDDKLSGQDPHPALSPISEYQRMSECLNNSLDRWHERFASDEGRPYLALFYFCRLYVDSPQLSQLPGLVEYPPNQVDSIQPPKRSLHEMHISGKAVDYAWAILDHVGSREGGRENICPIWDPLIVFLAALVVWAKTQQHIEQGGGGGRMKQLLVFKLELDQMPWPCSAEMASTLDRILRAP